MEPGGNTKGGAGELREQLRLLSGRTCWSVTAGESTGSQAMLHFGSKVPRARPLSNQRLSRDERSYEGEFDLFIECAWRLEQAGAVVCGSTDSNRNNGPMVEGLRLLPNRSIMAVSVADSVPDLVLRVDGGVVLHVFCDQTNTETPYDNYSLRVGDTIFVVGPRGEVTLESRSSH